LSQILDELGLYDTYTIMDKRTSNIISNFMYYKSNATPPAPFNNLVWFSSVQILDGILNRTL